jgi:predicted acyltransferase
VIYGRNAILVFVASGLLAKTLALVKVSGPAGAGVSMQAWLHRTLLASWLPPCAASWPTPWPTSCSGMSCCVSSTGARST